MAHAAINNLRMSVVVLLANTWLSLKSNVRWPLIYIALGIVTVFNSPAVAAKLHFTDYESTSSADSATFKLTCNAWLTGRIVAGDAKRVESKLLEFARSELRTTNGANSSLSALRRDARQRFYVLCLSGVGGDIREALDIAQHFVGWATVVPEGATCESACAVVFMKAGRRNRVSIVDRTRPGRYLHVKGKLGFHSPMLDYAQKNALVSTSEVSDAYARALRTMQHLAYENEKDEGFKFADAFSKPQRPNYVGIGDIEGFMPRDLILAMLLTPPTGMFYVTTVGEALNWGIDIIGYREPKNVTSEMLRIGCLNIIQLRCQAADPLGTCFRNSRLPSSLISRSSSAKELLAIAQFGYRLEDFAQSRLWPPDGSPLNGLVVHGFRYGDIDWDPMRNEAACRIRIILVGQRLKRLEIDTFNGGGVWRYLGPGSFDRLGDPLSISEAQTLDLQLSGHDTRETDKYSFRTWMMLPLGVKISTLAVEMTPWAEMNEQAAYLDPAVKSPISTRTPKKVETRDCALTWEGCPK